MLLFFFLCFLVVFFDQKYTNKLPLQKNTTIKSKQGVTIAYGTLQRKHILTHLLIVLLRIIKFVRAWAGACRQLRISYWFR